MTACMWVCAITLQRLIDFVGKHLQGDNQIYWFVIIEIQKYSIFQVQEKVAETKEKKETIEESIESTKSEITQIDSSDRTRSVVNYGNLEKGAVAMNSVITAIGQFDSAESTMDYIEASMTIVSAISEFLPPPASMVTETISGNIF